MSMRGSNFVSGVGRYWRKAQSTAFLFHGRAVESSIQEFVFKSIPA